MTETLTHQDGDECPVCNGTGVVAVLVHGFFTTRTEDRPCTAPLHYRERRFDGQNDQM